MTAAHYLAFKEKLVPMEAGKQQLERKLPRPGAGWRGWGRGRLAQAWEGWWVLLSAPRAAQPCSS
jgi:hypothetical protein